MRPMSSLLNYCMMSRKPEASVMALTLDYLPTAIKEGKF